MKKTLYSAIEERGAELSQNYEDKANGLPVITSVSTGLASLDAYGLCEPSILTVWEAHPGDGKTSVLQQLLKGAVSQGYTPKAYLFEDPIKLVADRYLAAELGESAFKLRRLEIASEGIGPRLSAACRELDWTRQVIVEDIKMSSTELFLDLETCDESTGLIGVDYAQAFDAEHDEKNVERVVARLAWGLNEFSKKTGISSNLFSQVKAEVQTRGKKWFDNWRFQKDRKGEDTTKADPVAVEGYRPLGGDAQWSTALWHKCKDAISIFRPGRWLNEHGLVCQDDVIEFLRVKGNYSPSKRPVRCRWNGATSEIKDK